MVDVGASEPVDEVGTVTRLVDVLLVEMSGIDEEDNPLVTSVLDVGRLVVVVVVVVD